MLDGQSRMEIPANESQRLQTLQLYKILDTGAERAFDDLTRLAATVCETPISLVSFIDRKRQWIKSCFGLEITETSRDAAFCAYTILEDGLTVVEDATEDPRFADNIYVTGEPGIRFYAGAPLTVGDGLNIGSLCVIDTRPRTLTANQLESLRVMRDAVTTQLEMKRNVADLEALERALSMCAWCHKVCTEHEGEHRWQPLHEYVADQTPVSHGICPECQKVMKSQVGRD